MKISRTIYKYYFTCILNLFLSKQLTINKFTLLDCTNTKVLLYFIHRQNQLVPYHRRTLFWYRHTHDDSSPELYTWRVEGLYTQRRRDYTLIVEGIRQLEEQELDIQRSSDQTLRVVEIRHLNKHKGGQKSARIKKILKNARFMQNLLLKVVSSSSKNTNNPQPVILNDNVELGGNIPTTSSFGGF